MHPAPTGRPPGFWGLRLRVQGLGFGVWGLGFRSGAWGLGVRVDGVGFMGFRV